MMSGPARRDLPRTTCRMKLPWWTISLRLRPSTPRHARHEQLMSSAISRWRWLNTAKARLKASRSPGSADEWGSSEASAKTASPSSSWISSGGASASMTPSRSTPVTSAPCSSSVAVTNAVNPEISARTRNPDSDRCVISPSLVTETPEAAGRETRARGLELVDEVDQLAQAAEGAVVEGQDQARQIGELVELLRYRSGREPRRPRQDVGELVLELGEVPGMDRTSESEDQIVADDARGVVDPVEARDLADGLVGRIHDPEQRRVLRIDEPALHQGPRDPPMPDAPVRLGPGFDQHHRHQRGLARLHQGEELEGLVHRAEAA